MTNLLTLKKYFLRYKWKIFFGIVFILLSNAGTVYVPIIIKDSINELQSSLNSETITNYALLIVVASLFSGIFRFMIRQTIIVVSREIEYDLRGDFWSHIQQLPLRYFQNNSTGNIMAHATNDINAVRMFIGPAVMYSIDTLIRLIIVVVIMFTISPMVTIYALLPLPLLSFLVYFVGRKIHERFTRIQEKFSELTTKAQENFSGIRVIKSYVREENEIETFKVLSKDYLHKNMHLVKLQALFQPILFLVTGLSVIVVMWSGGVRVIEKELLLGDITALIIYLGILTWPMIAFGWVINIIQQAEASMKRLNKIFHEPYEIEDSTLTDSSLTSVKGNIEFKNVTFRYNDNSPIILDNIDLSIPEGTTLAIMGHTGSGKTSFVNLISRLYDVTGGEILIDGKPVKHFPLSVLRKNIGFVQQETFLFSDSIMNNLGYGLSEVNTEKIINAAKIAQFDKDVKDFPNQYETVIGERGITLSGGQKQRATLTRALAIDPKILILDDSFSAVDTNTEEEILSNLKSFMKGRTSIIISHRVSTVKDADKIVVLDKGKIAESGTHARLIELNGIYADIYYKQLLEKELEELN
ncbi:MAG: ABC transporter ATP-binding protein [Ignavibacteriaceae bacterium]|nr:ABC transporter ATP-binding protein [Ignavibacteriaceae bacterium]